LSELGLRGVVILVDHPSGYGFSADGSQVGYVPDGLRLNVRGPLLPGLMRPVAVVMGQVLAEHQGQVALIEDQGPVQALAPQRSHEPLRVGVGRRRRLHPIQMIGTGVSG
jgi:hypothetical protein